MKALARIAGLALSCVLCLLLLEGATRALRLAPKVYRLLPEPGSSYRISDNPLLGYEIKENERNPGAGGVELFSYTNSHGQRDIERTVEKPPGVRRIVMLGDSVLAGVGLPELDDTISRQLEKLYGDGRTEVLNFGVGGYCTMSEAELFRVKARAFHPDLVVVLFVHNDYWCDDGGVFIRDKHKYRRRRYERPSFLETLFLKSAFFRALCLDFNLFYFRSEVDAKFSDDLRMQASGKNSVLRGFDLLSQLAEQDGFKIIVAVWPNFTSHTIDDEMNHPKDASDPRRLRIEAEAESKGMRIYRLSKGFIVRPGDNPRKLYTTDDTMHPNRLGSKVAAELLYEIIEGHPPANATSSGKRR